MELVKDKYITNNIDYSILNYCFESFVWRNFEYLNLDESYHKTCKICPDISKELFEYRLFYLIWLWYIELEQVPDIEEVKIRCKNAKILLDSIVTIDWKKKIVNKTTYYKYFLNWKITSKWIEKYEELSELVESNKWIKWFINKIKSIWELVYSYKYLAVLSLTWICIIMIFVFDIKVSAYLAKLPLISSIIDTDLLKQFEDVNDNDEYYKQIKNEIWIDKINFWADKVENGSSSMTKTYPTNDQGISDIKVKKISENERMFRITLNDWEEQLIPVNKLTDWKFKVNLPQALRQKLQNIKKNFPNSNN